MLVTKDLRIEQIISSFVDILLFFERKANFSHAMNMGSANWHLFINISYQNQLTLVSMLQCQILKPQVSQKNSPANEINKNLLYE